MKRGRTVRKSLLQQRAIQQSGQALSPIDQKRTDLPLAALSHSTAKVGGHFTSCYLPRKLMLQVLGITAGLTLGAWAHAMGLGAINVVSALGQPLKAEIELVAVSRSDKPGLVARLASPDAYKGAGLEYPYGVKYSFEVGSRANGEPYLKLTSNQEINDPFVSLLIELSWSSGKLMREYTFLLDPPGYAAVKPKPSDVQAVLPESVKSVPLKTAPQEEVRPVSKTVEAPSRPTRVEQPVEKRTDQYRREGSNVATGSITVKKGDTLNKIAVQNKAPDISLERMLVALYRANADQFDGKNMNRIRSGKILRMPDRDELINVAQAEADQEIRAQSTDWNAYRQKLAGAVSTRRSDNEAQHVVSGKVTSKTADQAPVATESAKEVLRLSKGESPADKAGVSARSELDRKNAAAEDLIAKNKAVEEGKARAALLESNLKDMQRLAQLKSEAAALVASAAVSKVIAASEVAAVSDVAAASAVAAANKVVAASEVVAVVVASDVAAVSDVKSVDETSTIDQWVSLLDKLGGASIVAAVGVVLLFVLGGIGFYIRKRKQTPASEGRPAERAVGVSTGHLAVPVAPSPDTGDFTATAIHAVEAVHQSDSVDPISEADLFLNFGRDEQAVEVLKDALRHSPDNHNLHLKLLGIYANRQDAAAFAETAELLEKTGDTDAMQQAVVLARKLQSASVDGNIEDDGSATQFTTAFKIELDQADFSGASAIKDAESVEDADEFAAPTEAIDFDVTGTNPVQGGSVDFDVTSTSPILAMPDVLDFDIAGKLPELDAVTPEKAARVNPHEDEALPSLDDLIFDVMSENEAVPEVGLPEAKKNEEIEGMEFKLDFPLDDVAEETVVQAHMIDLSNISLEMDDVGVAAVVSTEKGERWHEVATKLDLARAYQEMGDEVGAREILDEVLLEGDEGQKQEAQLLIKQLG
jgi:pilus assembly protein FimV